MQNANITIQKITKLVSFRHSRKCQSVLPLTIGLILFNLFFYILVGAFAGDPMASDIGQSAFGEMSLNNSETSDSELTITETKGFLSRFFIISYLDLPWWGQAFIILVNLILIPLTILAWIRGV